MSCGFRQMLLSKMWAKQGIIAGSRPDRYSVPGIMTLQSRFKD